MFRLSTILLVLSFALFGTYSQANAQCTGGSLTGTLTTTAAWQTVSHPVGSFYYTFTGTAGYSYQFSFCNGGGNSSFDSEITILSSTGTSLGAAAYNNVGCMPGSKAELTWACTVTATYRVYITRFPCIGTTAISTLAYRHIAPFGPGATCASPYVIPSLPFTHSGVSTCGSGNEYNSTHACLSGYMNGEDVVYTYTAPSAQCLQLNISGTPGFHGLFVLNGCPSTGGTTCMAKIDSAGGSTLNVSLPSAGTYYIVVDGLNPPNACISYNLSVDLCPSGANCANPRVIPSLPYVQSGLTTCGFGNDYNSTHACGSTYMNGDDFVFSYTSPGNECIDIHVTGASSYAGLFVTRGCPNAGGATCIAEDEPIAGQPDLTGVYLATAGTYYIVVDKLPAPSCTPFNIQVDTCMPPVPCGPNPPPNDLCLFAPDISGYDPFCGSTDPAYYDIDIPGNLNSVFCGVIDNNAWFAFVADSTTVSFYFDVGPCELGLGIQAMVLSTPNCTTFTAASPCWNPGVEMDGTVTATGLTPGQTYYLMIDGQANDDCEYTVTGVGILPVEWGTFTVRSMKRPGSGNLLAHLEWSTFSETNNTGFHIERGVMNPEGVGETGSIGWTEIGMIPGEGDYTGKREYTFTDAHPVQGERSFYRIRQMDVDGYSNFSEITEFFSEVPVRAPSLMLYPNPATETLFAEVLDAGTDILMYEVISLEGALLAQVAPDGVQTRAEFGVNDLPAGIYILRVRGEGWQVSQRFSVVR